jgi:uncharacterized protein (DUF2336 family)
MAELRPHSLIERLQAIIDKLAANRPDERAAAVESLSELVAAIGGDAGGERIKQLAVELVRAIIREIETPLRRLVAERLSHDATIAPSIVMLLAADEIEVAWPVLAGSPVLQEPDLIAIANKATMQHRVAIAGRTDVGAALCDVLAAFGEKDVIGTMLANERAQISSAAFAVIVDLARQWPELEDPLAQRADLPAAIAFEMLSWIADALHGFLYRRISMAPSALREIVAAAADQVAKQLADGEGVVPGILGAMLGHWGKWGEAEIGGFVKLAAAGRLDLFEAALAEFAREPLRLVRAACRAQDYGDLATMCRAAGMNRSNFEAIVSALAAVQHPGHGALAAQAVTAFDTLSLQQARAARAMVPAY